MRASINIGCASRWFGSLQRPVGIRSLAVPLISRSGPVRGVVTYAYRQAATVPLTYPAMTGFFAEGRFPQGRREAAGKQTRLVTGRAHTQTAMAATNKYLRQSNKSRTGGEATKKRDRTTEVSKKENFDDQIVAFCRRSGGDRRPLCQ
jgi:hypothetical protein